MKNLVLIVCLFTISFSSFGQKRYVEVGTGFKKGTITPNLGIFKDFYLGKKDKFIIGTGLRYTGFFGNNILFTSAPPSISLDPAKTDSLDAPKPSIQAVNVLINLGYAFNKLKVGFNIDAAGISFGPEGSPTFITNNKRTSVKAKPTSPNVLLVGDRDIGSLNSLLYANYTVKEKLGLSIGAQFLFNELKTATKVQTSPEANDRFRVKSLSPFIGLRFGF